MNRSTLLAGCLMLMAAMSPLRAHAAWVTLTGGGGEYAVATSSILDRRFNGVIRQQYDYSCGSAALATLLTHFYGRPRNEKTVLEAMYAVGDQEKIQKQGFSLLDMKKYLGSLGYEADGFRDSLDKLRRVGVPAIALINMKGYMHFVVVAGVTEDSVIVLDPAKGRRILRRGEFEGMWNNILFVVQNNMEVARKNFNEEKAWTSHRQARFNSTINTADVASNALHTVHMPGGYF